MRAIEQRHSRALGENKTEATKQWLLTVALAAIVAAVAAHNFGVIDLDSLVQGSNPDICDQQAQGCNFSEE